MAQMNSPAICPVSSPSNSPAHNKPMTVRGYSNSSDCPYTQVVLNRIPTSGPDVEIDEGPFTTGSYEKTITEKAEHAQGDE